MEEEPAVQTPGTGSADNVGFSYFSINKGMGKSIQTHNDESTVTQRKNLVLGSFLTEEETSPSTASVDNVGFSYFPQKGKKEKDWEARSYANLPDWMKDNAYIKSGYRPELQSFSECFKSIFRIHTETGNIWTHLIGFLVFVGITIIFYIKPFCETCDREIKLSEKLTFLFFFLGAMICMGVSSLYHTVQCHSQQVSKSFKKMDYAGIVTLIVGSFVPFIYYAFYCQRTAQVVYLTTISLLGLGTILVTLMDRFGTPEYRKVRAALFVCLGGFGFVPGIHCITSNGWDNAVQNLNMDGVLLMAFLYIFGAFLYGMRIPERFIPGYCDIWCQSHQIFHTLVFMAALVHYKAVSSTGLFRMSLAGQCEE